MSGATGLRFTFTSRTLDGGEGETSSHSTSTPRGGGAGGGDRDAPFFERIGAVEEMQRYKRAVELLQARVGDLERINTDLEYRLEDQAKQCMTVEKECISLERKWRAKCELLEKDTETWKREYESEKQKSDKLREHLSRTERELYSILQRKYELMRTGPQGGRGGGGGGGGASAAAAAAAAAAAGDGKSGLGAGEGGGKSNSSSSIAKRGSFSEAGAQNPNGVDDLFWGRGIARAPQEIRQRRMMASLSDFLGL